MDGFCGEVVVENHEETFLQRMNKLRKENRYCNVSFNIKGKEFPCHQIVLVLASSYFDTMFNGNFSESSFKNITLQDIEPEALEEILTAIYTSRFHLNPSNAYFLLRASHMLLLTDIFNAIVSHICVDCEAEYELILIDYLIEMCLFAKQIGRTRIYSNCIATLAFDLDNLSRTDHFNEKITLDMFKEILSQDLRSDCTNEDKFRIIMQWNNHNKCTEEEVLNLLDSAGLGSDHLSTPIMAKLIVNNTVNDGNYSTCQCENKKNTASSGLIKMQSSTNIHRRLASDVCHNIYLNAIDVKSGSNGWATLQSKQEFNEYEVLNYQRSNSTFKKVKNVGSKLYCFEHLDWGVQKTAFSCFENGQETELTTPPEFSANLGYDMEVLGNVIYLISGSGRMWTYDCETDRWMKVPIQRQSIHEPTSGIKRTHSELDDRLEVLHSSLYSTPKLVSCDRTLYIIGVTIPNTKTWGTGIIRVTPNQPVSLQNSIHCLRKHVNPAVCSYDRKLVICGSNYDNQLHKHVSVYDMVANKWYEHIAHMNIGRANHTLNHHNGFLYAIENKLMVPNEKYDTKLDKWTYIPSLPRRLHFAQENITLATGNVFNVAVV